MANEELTPLHKDENGNDEEPFWVEERHIQARLEDEKASPEAQHGVAQLSREELVHLAAQIAVASSAPQPPSEEGSDTYLG